MKKYAFWVVAAVVLALLAIFAIITKQTETVSASVPFANEYLSTTTPFAWAGGVPVLLKTGQGSLGSVVVTSSVGGGLYFYDATTSNITKRTGNKATSTLAVIFPLASSTPGTYTFDIVFNDGLLVQASSSPLIQPITTITWR